MGEIVEYQAAYGNLLNVKHAAGFGQVLQRRVVRVERLRNEGLGAMGFILQGPEFEQMINPVFVVRDVAVKHSCIRFQANLMRELGGVQPLVSVNLVIANYVTHAVGKNLCAS